MGTKSVVLGMPSAGAVSANTAAIAGLSAQLDARDQKQSVRLASTSNLPLSGLAAIDGFTPVAGDRIGALGQTLSQNSGIYIAAAGAWSRATDADTSAEVTSGMFFWVTEGTANGDKAFELTTDDPIVLGTTPLTFQQYAGALKASQVVNDSTVTGATVAAALNTHETAIATNTAALRGRNWTWANAAARLAQTGLVAGDIGKRGYQTDMDLQYELLAVTPAVRWGRLEDLSMAPPSGAFANNNNLSGGLQLTVGVVSGTLSSRTPTTTTKASRLKRTTITSGAVAGNTAYIRGVGGLAVSTWGCPFRYRATVVLGVVSATMRWAYGHYAVIVNADTAPTASGFLTDAIAFGADLNLSPNLQIYNNDAAGSATATDLGASFPANAANNGYEIEFYSDGTNLVYSVLNLNTGAEASGTISSNLPADGVSLQHGFYSTNHNDAVGVSVDVNQVVIQERHR